MRLRPPSSSRSGRTTASSSARAASGFSTTCRLRRAAAVASRIPPDVVSPTGRRADLNDESTVAFRGIPRAAAVANIDGGSRGNPGPAGYGVRIEQDDGTVVELKESLGIATNNVAEYSGLLAALPGRLAHGVRPSARPLRLRAARETDAGRLPREESRPAAALGTRRAASCTGSATCTFEHVRREFNKDADRLANEAMDEAAAR